MKSVLNSALNIVSVFTLILTAHAYPRSTSWMIILAYLFGCWRTWMEKADALPAPSTKQE